MRGLYAIWVAAMTVALFCLASFVMFAIYVWTTPVKAAEPIIIDQSAPEYQPQQDDVKLPLKGKKIVDHCLIGRVVFDNQMTATDHAVRFVMPDDLSRSFIVAWNKVIEANPVPVTADSVTIYGNSKFPGPRIGFFKKSCLMEVFDIQGDGFWKVVGEASGSKREI